MTLAFIGQRCLTRHLRSLLEVLRLLGLPSGSFPVGGEAQAVEGWRHLRGSSREGPASVGDVPGLAGLLGGEVSGGRAERGASLLCGSPLSE